MNGQRSQKMILEFVSTLTLSTSGLPEEFTKDAEMLHPSSALAHLNEHGLPTLDCKMFPGMLLVCKIGTTTSYDWKVIDFDNHFFVGGTEARTAKHKHMFYDDSLYVPAGVYGTVKEAHIEPHGQFGRAIVRIETVSQ